MLSPLELFDELFDELLHNCPQSEYNYALVITIAIIILNDSIIVIQIDEVADSMASVHQYTLHCLHILKQYLHLYHLS